MSDEPRPRIIEWGMMDRSEYLRCTVFSSFLLRIVQYPFILVKTRLQIQRHNATYSGTLDAFRKIYHGEKIPGLYRGFWTNSTQVLSGIAYIATYEKTRDLVTTYTNISDSKLINFISGGSSSAVTQTVIIPIDVVSQHIMVALHTRRPTSSKLPAEDFKSSYFKPLNLNQEEVRRKGLPLAITKQLYRDNGLKSFYRGYIAALACAVPSSALWWSLYDTYNGFMYNNIPAARKIHYLALQTLSGGLSGVSVAILTNPLDLLRTNVQVHRPSSYKSAVKYLWKEDRWRIFTKGLSARVTQSIITSSLHIIAYESIKRYSLKEEYKDSIKW